MGLLTSGSIAAVQAPRPSPSRAFTWGQGGKRMTQEEIAIAQRQAAQRMSNGGSYAPVDHWLQGAARLSEGILGGVQMRDTRRAQEANAAESDIVVQALLEGMRGGATDRGSVAAALANPRLDDRTHALAEMEWKRMNPVAPEPTEMQRNYDWLAGQGRAADAEHYLQGRIDPEIVIPMPDGPYVGPRSRLSSTIAGAQIEPETGSPSQPTDSGAAQPGFTDMSGATKLLQSMGPQGFVAWQRRYGTSVLVNSPEEMARLPKGTRVRSPDGREGVKN